MSDALVADLQARLARYEQGDLRFGAVAAEYLPTPRPAPGSFGAAVLARQAERAAAAQRAQNESDEAERRAREAEAEAERQRQVEVAPLVRQLEAEIAKLEAQRQPLLDRLVPLDQAIEEKRREIARLRAPLSENGRPGGEHVAR
jgi:DNA repair exonuclease SbcCD ATPase subunit